MSLNPLPSVSAHLPPQQAQPVGQPSPLQDNTPALAATTRQATQPPAQRSPSALNVTANTETRADGDKELSVAYRAALHQIKGDTAHDDSIKVYPVPSYSTFGQWWSQLGWALQSPPVKQWMENVGVAPESIVLLPGSGQIQYRLKPELDPDRRLHTLTQANSDWAAISGPLMETARILVANDATAKFKPPLLPHSPEAPLGVIRRFYQEPPVRTRSDALVRSASLLRDKAFVELPADSHMKLHESRSETMLDRHQAILADIDTRYQASNELKHLAGAVRADSDGATNIARELLTRQIFVPLVSSYQPTGADKNNGVSLKQYLDDHGLDLPANHEQLDNLANALTTAQWHHRSTVTTPAHWGGLNPLIQRSIRN